MTKKRSAQAMSKILTAGLMLFIAAPAIALTDEELQQMDATCKQRSTSTRAPGGGILPPFTWLPGWEACGDIHDAYLKAAPGIAEKQKMAKEEAERQRVLDAVKSLRSK
jgi:hypothetical protein